MVSRSGWIPVGVERAKREEVVFLLLSQARRLQDLCSCRSNQMSHGRTPLFRKLMQSVQQAHWLNQHPGQHAFFFEAREASRVSRRDFVRMLGAAGFITAAGGFAPLAARAKETRPPGASHRDPVAI